MRALRNTHRLHRWLAPLVALVVAFTSALLVGGARSAGPTAGLIAFTRSDGIYVMQPDGTGVRSLRRGTVASHAFDLDWSPDGSRLAFESRGSLWVMDADGKDLARLVAPRDVDGWEGRAGNPSWSPTGRRIAFTIGIKCCSKPRDEEIRGIWVVDADGSKPRRLVRLKELGADMGVSDIGVGEIDWSPDGHRFVFAAHSGWFSYVYVVNADSGMRLRRLTAKGWACAVNPQWSPDSRRIVFEQTPSTSNRIGPETGEIFVMSASGGSQARLTSNRVADASPTWSPDGRRIAFVRFQNCTVCSPATSGPSELFVMNADGTEVRRLTHNRIEDASPAWQPVASAEE